MYAKINEALSKMILSASGWRTVFASDGDEESSYSAISLEHKIISAAAAKVFSEFLGEIKGAVIVGIDSRPTGEAIANAVIRSLVVCGREVLYTGIAAAPEIMAFARLGSGQGLHLTENSVLSISGFIYISASHNPIGHNGFKFGLTDGGVLDSSDAILLTKSFKSFMSTRNLMEEMNVLLADSGERLTAVYSQMDNNKKAALASYNEFTAEVVSGYIDNSVSFEFFHSLRNGLEKSPISIAVDFNGSARTVSIDKDLFTSLGINFYSMNDSPGKIAHRIVPEGESLDPCRIFMEDLHKKDSSLIMGYVPDCDGDRGNIVIWDDEKQRARPLEAQEVFAIACIAELSHLVWKGELKKAAVVVNDPTSLRVDRIAHAFNVSVFRAEVGEANVVGLARKLREQGYLVRILGEGSAGGTITHPSAVRDPIVTLCAILKLLALRANDGHQGLFEIWCRLSGQPDRYKEDFKLSDIIASLPAFFSTGSYTEDALLNVKTKDHAKLKDFYQKIFNRQWEEKKDMLFEKYGISTWEAIAYNGIEERRGISRFSDAERGGLKIEFFRQKDDAQEKAAFIWMRGSGTEPVFRVMADTEDPELERILIKWQREMVLEADNS